MTDEQIPTEQDWGCLPSDDLDIRAAFEDFYGKSNAEMQSAFSRCVIEMADSLRWMPSKPFRYYMKGFADFVMSNRFHEMDAADVASNFLRLVEYKLRQQPRDIAPLMDMILPIVAYLAKRQQEYQADVDIYGDFTEKNKEIEELWAIERQESEK